MIKKPTKIKKKRPIFLKFHFCCLKVIQAIISGDKQLIVATCEPLIVFNAKYVIIKFKTLIRFVLITTCLKEAFSKGIFLKYI